MTTPLDTKLREKAQSGIRKFAATASTLTRTAVTSYSATSGAEVTSALTASVLMSPPVSYTTREIDGSSIRRGDSKILLAAADLEAAWSSGAPMSGDTVITTAGLKFRVVDVMPHYSGDLVALYEMQVRS